MEWVLTNTIMNDIYSYLTWRDLRKIRHVPSNMWRSWYDYFCQDAKLEADIKIYWGSFDIKNLSHKILLLNYMDFQIKHWNLFYESVGGSKLPQILIRDKDFVLDKINTTHNVDWLMKQHVDWIFKDENAMLDIIKQNPWFMGVHEVTRNNREFIMKALMVNPDTLFFADPQYYQDVELLETAAREMGLVPCENIYRTLLIDHLNKYGIGVLHEIGLPEDAEIIELALNLEKMEANDIPRRAQMAFLQMGWRVEDLDSAFQINNRVILGTLEYDLETNSLRQINTNPDRATAMAGIEKHGYNLCHAGNFRSDKDAVLRAIKKRGSSLYFSDPNLLRDKEFMIEVMRYDISLVKYVNRSLGYDANFVAEFVRLCNKKL